MYEVTESKRAESKGEERPSLSTAAMPHKGRKVRNKEGRKQTKAYRRSSNVSKQDGQERDEEMMKKRKASKTRTLSLLEASLCLFWWLCFLAVSGTLALGCLRSFTTETQRPTRDHK